MSIFTYSSECRSVQVKEMQKDNLRFWLACFKNSKFVFSVNAHMG